MMLALRAFAVVLTVLDYASDVRPFKTVSENCVRAEKENRLFHSIRNRPGERLAMEPRKLAAASYLRYDGSPGDHK